MTVSGPSAAEASGPPRPESHLLVGWTLLVGLLVSIVVMVLGLIFIAIQGTQKVEHVLPLDQIWNHLRQGDPAAVLDLGILLLFATPLVGVVVALATFALERDSVYVAVTALLLVILVAGFAVALRS